MRNETPDHAAVVVTTFQTALLKMHPSVDWFHIRTRK